MNLKSIAHKIRQKREEQNLTQDFIADTLGISQRAYSKLESGETRLRVEHLIQLSEILKTNLADLVSDEKSKYINIAEKQVGFQFIEKQVVGNRQNIAALQQEVAELKTALFLLQQNSK
jgi:transcriptional regulator with XRE-family HTH domain